MNIKLKPQYRSNKIFMYINHRTQTQQTRICNNNFSKCIFHYSCTDTCDETVDATERREGGPQP